MAALAINHAITPNESPSLGKPTPRSEAEGGLLITPGKLAAVRNHSHPNSVITQVERSTFVGEQPRLTVAAFITSRPVAPFFFSFRPLIAKSSNVNRGFRHSSFVARTRAEYRVANETCGPEA